MRRAIVGGVDTIEHGTALSLFGQADAQATSQGAGR